MTQNEPIIDDLEMNLRRSTWTVICTRLNDDTYGHVGNCINGIVWRTVAKPIKDNIRMGISKDII